MKNLNVFCVVVLTCLPICFVSTNVLSGNTQADLIIQKLDDQDWLEEETQCLSDTLLILNNVKNHTLWAVWIWNSMQHPTGTFYGSRYSLGNYDQCLKAPSVSGDPGILTQYCLVDVKLTDDEPKKEKFDVYGAADDFLKVKSKFGRVLNLVTWGTCLPASCNPHAVVKILKTMYSVNPLASADPEITIDNCQIAGEKTEYSFRFFAFLTFMTLLVLVAIVSTIYLEYAKEDTTATRIAYSFSLKRNWSSFTRTSVDEIPCLSFTKTVQLITTTCTHGSVFTIVGAISNGADFDEVLGGKGTIGKMLQHIDLPTVENFFVISGLLVMKSLMDGKRKPIISLLQRYIRLIGSLSFLVFYSISVAKYTGDGPLWNKLTGRELKACEENWFWSLLMINNYVNNEGICQLVAWYVPCDYQLAVIGTVLFCIWQWNKRIGKVIAVLATSLAFVVPGIVTYWKQIPGILIYDVETITEVRNNVVYLDTYMKSHNRAGPYFLGMALGYILMVYKPAKYRGVISRLLSYIGFAAASLLAFQVWTSAGAWCLGEYNAWNSALYAAFNRNFWAIATCMCIAITEYGDVPKIRSIISWPGFTIVSRLAYGVYITHSLILQRNIFSRRNPMQFDMFSLIVDGLGVLTASSIFAILLWLFVESPLSNLTNLLLVPEKPKVLKKELETNGHTLIHPLKNGKTL